MGRPSSMRVTLTTSVECTGVGDERLLIARATVNNDIRGKFGNRNWMVQWFRSDGNKEERRNERKLRNPRWDGTTVVESFIGFNPGAWLIRGNTARIKVSRQESEHWTVWMWPGEQNEANSFTTNNEFGVDKGPKDNADPQKSLSGIEFYKDDQVESVFANGVFKVLNQRTIGGDDDREYEANWQFLWSTKYRGENLGLGDDRYVYWYIINSESGYFNTEVKECSGDYNPPPEPEIPVQPGPGDPDPDPDPPIKATLTVSCGQYPGDELKATFKKCVGTQRFQWQVLRGADNWESIQGATDATYIPQFPGNYRCRGKCGVDFVNSNSCFIDEKPREPTPEPTPPDGCEVTDMDWPGAPEFPLYVPTGRVYTLGEYPVDFNYCTRGNEIAVLRGNQLVKTILRLTYANVPDTMAIDFLTHFNSFGGTSNTFSLLHTGAVQGPAGGMDMYKFASTQTLGGRTEGGGSKGLLWGGVWRYQKAPKVQSVRPGISTVNIELERLSGVDRTSDGSEERWPGYPNFPMFVPHSRSFQVGDWNTEWFSGPDKVEVGVVTSPQRDSLLDLSYQSLDDIDASAFFRHYQNMRGSSRRFELGLSTATYGPFGGFDKNTEDDGCKKWYEGGKWCYAAPPSITSVRKGISTVRVRLRCPFVAPQFITE